MITRLCITLNLLLCCCLYGQGNVVTDWATIVQPALTRLRGFQAYSSSVAAAFQHMETSPRRYSGIVNGFAFRSEIVQRVGPEGSGKENR